MVRHPRRGQQIWTEKWTRNLKMPDQRTWSSRFSQLLSSLNKWPASEQRGSSQWSTIGVISSTSVAKYSRGALWQRPLLPSFLFFLAEYPGYFFQGTRPWQRLGSRLTTCCWIRKNPGVGFGRRYLTSLSPHTWAFAVVEFG